MIHSSLSLKSLFIFLVLAVMGFGAGCEKKVEQPKKSVVVSQRIQADDMKTTVAVSPEKNIIPEKEQPEASELEVEILQKDTPGESSVDPELLDLALEEEAGSFLEIKSAGQPDLYDPENKIDPFRPLFREEPKKKEIEVAQKAEREKRIPRTPLERIHLNQLNLVGVIQASGENRGLVEEGSGRGYIVSLGTYIGTNGGRVIDILNDRVIVEEETEDILGELTLQKRELRLQKPFGEN